MGLNKTLLTYTIIFNIINGLLFIYEVYNPRWRSGNANVFRIPPVLYIGLIGLIVIGIRNRKDFGRAGNWLLAIFLHPYPDNDYSKHDCRAKSTLTEKGENKRQQKFVKPNCMQQCICAI